MVNNNRAQWGVVIVAAGSGTRFGNAEKVFAPLGDQPVLAHSLLAFCSCPTIKEVVLVLGRHTAERGAALLRSLGLTHVHVCLGGAYRADSVRAGLAALPQHVQLVAVHDAARPLVSVSLIERVVTMAQTVGAAIPVIPVRDTIHSVSQDDRLSGVLDRSALRAAQTPQVARRAWLEYAYQSSAGGTDEAALLHAAGYPVALVDGDPANLKITWPGDLIIAEAILAARGA